MSKEVLSNLSIKGSLTVPKSSGGEMDVGLEIEGVQTQLDSKASDTNLTAHTGRTDNPHSVTKSQVGLGNVDNTSDINKPISTATQIALSGKVSKSGDESIGGLKTFEKLQTFGYMRVHEPEYEYPVYGDFDVKSTGNDKCNASIILTRRVGGLQKSTGVMNFITDGNTAYATVLMRGSPDATDIINKSYLDTRLSPLATDSAVVHKTGNESIAGVKSFSDNVEIGTTQVPKQLSIKGNLLIDGNITQNGSTYETHAQQVYTTDDKIIMRDGATAGLISGATSGLKFKKYDGTNDGELSVDSSGTARVGDIGDLQPLATRDEAGSMTNNQPVVWDSSGLKMVTRALVAGDIPNLDAGKITSGTIADARIPSGITRDTELTAHTGRTDNPHSVTKAQVGLSNVDNTSDTAKPISTATQTALNAKQDTITGGATTITSSNLATSRALVSDGSGKVTVSDVTSTELGYLDGVTSAVQTQLNRKADAVGLNLHRINTTNPHSVTKKQVGLEFADNTADVDKPISTATQTALNLKANSSDLTAHTGNTANPHSVTKAQVGLGNVDNTSDANKPVSTATQTALNGKVTANTAISAGTNTKITYDAKGLVTAGASLAEADIPTLSAGKINSGTFADARIPTLAISKTAGLQAALDAKIPTDAKGSPNGVAELGADGKVLSGQLPSYVDDVLEYDNLAGFPTPGETGKIYVAIDTNKTYRWSGTAYIEISSSLALGETSATAYRGDRGAQAYNHITDVSNPHGVTKAQVGLSAVANELQYSASNPPPYPVTSVAGKTGAVTLAEADIPALGAGKITSGTFADARIPALSISKITNLQTTLDGKVASNTAITAGTKAKITYDSKGLVTSGADLVADDIPGLPASKITSGSFPSSRLPALDASKITSGTFADARIPALAISKITGLQTALDGKQDTLTFDNAPISGSANPVKSGGVYNALNELTVNKEDAANKVNAWSPTPSNDKYPSEKLTKDSLDGKVGKTGHEDIYGIKSFYDRVELRAGSRVIMQSNPSTNDIINEGHLNSRLSQYPNFEFLNYTVDHFAGEVETLLSYKQDTLTFDDVPVSGSANPVKSGGVYDALADKQDKLTFDDVPTSDSDNPVKSGGVYDALQAVGGEVLNELINILIPPVNCADLLTMYKGDLTLTESPVINASGCTSLEAVFRGCTNLKTVKYIHTPDVVIMDYMFRDCSSLTSIPELDTSNVTGMSQMFFMCSSLTSVPALDVSKVTRANHTFYRCSSLTSVTFIGDVVPPYGIDMFYSTPIASGNGYIFVPDDMVDEYKAASGWSAHASIIKGISEKP